MCKSAVIGNKLASGVVANEAAGWAAGAWEARERVEGCGQQSETVSYPAGKECGTCANAASKTRANCC
jgi:hypothetical protein